MKLKNEEFEKDDRFITVICIICGKKQLVHLKADGSIIGDWAYFGEIVRGIGDWSYCTLVRKDGKTTCVRCQPWYKELYYRLRDIKRKIFHQYEVLEFWECPECLGRKKNDNEST